MKKLFSLFTSILFACSILASEVTILPSDFEPVTSTDFSLTKDTVTVEVTASTVTSDQIRVFKNQTIIISSDLNITKIEFICTANGTAKYGPGCFNEQEGYTFEISGKTGTWTGSSKNIEFTAELNQVRITQLIVTIDDTPTSISVLKTNDTYNKVLKGNQIVIVKDNKVYNMFGQNL